MKIPNRFLGVLGMAAAPFLWVETHFFVQAGLHNTSLTGLCDLLYMLGWAASITALLRLRAAGEGKANRAVLYAQLGSLALACVWNAWVIVAPDSEAPFFRLLDCFWPISNLLMLGTGTVVLQARRLAGWQRWAPLAVSGWFPFTALLGKLFGETAVMYYGMNGYSLVAWFCLGLAVATARVQAAPAAEEAQIVPAVA